MRKIDPPYASPSFQKKLRRDFWPKFFLFSVRKKVTLKSMLRNIDDHGIIYPALMFVCPGCASEKIQQLNNTGLHILPVNTMLKSPAWDWDGDLNAPTLSPSILTGKDSPFICHSFLRAGVFQFLTDSTHALSGQFISIPDLPDWITTNE